MRRIFLSFISVLCISLVLTFCCSCKRLKVMEEVSVETNTPPKIVFLGDSIASGYGLDGYAPGDNYNCRSYSNILKDKYLTELGENCRHIMVNDAVTGDNSSQLLDKLRSGSLDAALADSDAVVVSIGGNDMLELLFGIIHSLGYNETEQKFDVSEIDILSALTYISSLDSDIDTALVKFEKDLVQITDEIGSRTDGVIFIQTLYDPFEYFSKFKWLSDLSKEKLAKFNSIINENSERDGVKVYEVVDVASAFSGKCGTLTNISSYDIHPNLSGHAVIADIVDSAVKSHTYTYTMQVEVTDPIRAAIIGIWDVLSSLMPAAQ